MMYVMLLIVWGGSMTYGTWIERQCFFGKDWDFYHSEIRRLIERMNKYTAIISMTLEGRYLLSRFKAPVLAPLSISKVTHRQFIERLHIMIDVLCEIEALAGLQENGFYNEQRRNGSILFIPPSENKHERTTHFYS